MAADSDGWLSAAGTKSSGDGRRVQQGGFLGGTACHAKGRGGEGAIRDSQPKAK